MITVISRRSVRWLQLYHGDQSDDDSYITATSLINYIKSWRPVRILQLHHGDPSDDYCYITATSPMIKLHQGDQSDDYSYITATSPSNFANNIKHFPTKRCFLTHLQHSYRAILSCFYTEQNVYLDVYKADRLGKHTHTLVWIIKKKGEQIVEKIQTKISEGTIESKI